MKKILLIPVIALSLFTWSNTYAMARAPQENLWNSVLWVPVGLTIILSIVVIFVYLLSKIILIAVSRIRHMQPKNIPKSVVILIKILIVAFLCFEVYFFRIKLQPFYNREDKNNLDINYYDNSEPLNNSLGISDNNLEYDFDKSWNSEFFYQLQKDEANVPLPAWWIDGDWPLTTVNFPPKLVKGEVPRVIFWWGTRLHYYDTEQKKFLVEPDLKISNSSYDMLSFCRRYYPDTVFVKKYKREQPLLWDNNLQNYKIPTVKPWSFECVQ